MFSYSFPLPFPFLLLIHIIHERSQPFSKYPQKSSFINTQVLYIMYKAMLLNYVSLFISTAKIQIISKFSHYNLFQYIHKLTIKLSTTFTNPNHLNQCEPLPPLVRIKKLSSSDYVSWNVNSRLNAIRKYIKGSSASRYRLCSYGRTLIATGVYFLCHILKTWPIVDVLFQSHTADFPYIMVYEYVQKHKPMLINDIEKQQLLWDRIVTYKTLKEINVPVPKYFPLYLHENHANRLEKECYGKIFTQTGQIISYKDYMKNSPHSPDLFRKLYKCEQEKFCSEQFTENQNSLIIKSQGKQIQIHKPFIQKPLDSNDHKVSLYYQQSLGGGRRVLYRQDHGHTSSAQSHYQSDKNQIRKDQNYVYEEFIGTNVFDIKVYTVGEFIFAESRRSPMVDVEKDWKNSQLRHQVDVTVEERQYCRRIVEKFKLPICGLDILRSDGKSYVCDINGWAFAKGGGLNQEVSLYWDILAQLLRNMVFQKFFPQKAQKLSYQSFKDYNKKFQSKSQITVLPSKDEELRSVIQIISIKLETFQGNFLQRANSMTKMGEQIRKNSYDDLDCLGLYSKFENLLKVECLNNDIDKISVGYLLKGYLGIKGELSPSLISMIKTKTDLGVQKQSSEMVYVLQKVVANIQELQNERTKNKYVKLRTFIYVCNQMTLQDIQRLINSKQKNMTRKNGIKDKIAQIQRIELKIYEKNSFLQKNRQSKQIAPQIRLQIRVCYTLDRQSGKKEEMVTLVNFTQEQFIQIVKK